MIAASSGGTTSTPCCGAPAHLFLCPVVFYELWRGLRHRGADRQLDELAAFSRTLQWIDYDRDMWTQAAELWAIRRQRGQTHDDADLLIAAATLVTNNVTDFVGLDLPIVDWTVDQPHI